MIYFDSVEQLAFVLKYASIEHHEFEETLGRRDDFWPLWYAEYAASHAQTIKPATKPVYVGCPSCFDWAKPLGSEPDDPYLPNALQEDSE